MAHFTRGLRDELAGTNVIVQLVVPAATAADIWEISGVPLSNLDPAIVMDPYVMVDAALTGLDLGEAVTMASLEGIRFLAEYDSAHINLLTASKTGKPASRYRQRIASDSQTTQVAEIQ